MLKVLKHLFVYLSRFSGLAKNIYLIGVNRRKIKDSDATVQFTQNCIVKVHHIETGNANHELSTNSRETMITHVESLNIPP